MGIFETARIEEGGVSYEEEILQIAKDFKSLTNTIETMFPDSMKYEERKELYSQTILPQITEMRLAIFDRMKHDREFKKQLKAAGDNDFHFWCNLYANTYNPIFGGGGITPAVLFEYQRDFLQRIIDGESLICVKGRGMGFTWAKVWLDVWDLQRDNSNYQGIVISRVEEDLDMNGDLHQTIFGRMRFTIRLLPYQLPVKERTRFLNINGSQFIGKSSNPDAARSTRADRVYVEEAGVIDNFTLILRAINAVSNQRVIGGSVAGTSNGFFGYWDKATREGGDGYGVVLWKYDLHPLFKAPDWLDMERAKYGDDEAGFKQEVLVDWWASVTNQIFTKLRKDQMRPISAIAYGEFSKMEKCVGIDVGFGSSPTSLWYYYYNPINDNYYYTQYVEMKDSNYNAVAKRLRDDGWIDDTVHFIDEHSKKRGNDGKTLTSLLENEGLHIVEVSNQNIGASCSVSNVKLGNGQILFDENGEGIQNGFDLLSRYRYIDKYASDKQDKNEAADAGDSFRYSHEATYYFQRNKGVKSSNRYEHTAMRGKYSRIIKRGR